MSETPRFPGVGDTITFVSFEGDAIRTGVVAQRRGVHLRVMDVLEPLATGTTWRWSEWIRWPDALVDARREAA